MMSEREPQLGDVYVPGKKKENFTMTLIKFDERTQVWTCLWSENNRSFQSVALTTGIQNFVETDRLKLLVSI